jgi:flavin-dependent dehydrogenase
VPEPDYDVIIIGGGPAGATASMLLARQGFRVVVLERATFPRFHIGESLLPRNFPLIQELGLEEKLSKIPNVPKYGVEFAMADGAKYARYPFSISLLPVSPTVNIERAPFDKMLLDSAKEAGAEVREATTVKSIVRMNDGDVAVNIGDTEISAKWLIDASGQGAVVARHLGTRKTSDDPRLQKVAHFAHFENVGRREGQEGGYPLIVMADEGWFWLIPLDEKRTSVGLVLNPTVARNLNVPANRVLQWGIERSPAVKERMKNATGPDTNIVASDFSYRCRPYAGPGYFLIGDAAAFIDPIFSTGVCLAMLSGQKGAMHVARLMRSEISPAKARRQHIRFIDGTTGIFFRLIRQYYDHSFRELFLEGQGPLKVHRAILAILSGNVFPKPAFALRWRLWFFEILMWLNRHFQLVPKQQTFSLLNGSPKPVAS